jgi:hypothetical protein
VLQPVEALQDKVHSAAGPNLFRAGQTLFQETEKGRGGAAECLLGGDGEPADPVEDEHRRGRVDADDEAGPPVLEGDGQHNAAEQEQVAHDLDDDFGKEAGHLGHVAVDALDELARGRTVVKAHVQLQAVPCQVRAQGVGSRPGDAFPGVGGTHGEDLLEYGDPQEGRGQEQEALQRLPGQRRIDEAPRDLRVDDLQADVPQEQGGEEYKPPALGLEVAGEQKPVLPE